MGFDGIFVYANIEGSQRRSSRIALSKLSSIFWLGGQLHQSMGSYYLGMCILYYHFPFLVFSFTCLKISTIHKAHPLGVQAFTMIDKKLISVSVDGSIKIWEWGLK